MKIPPPTVTKNQELPFDKIGWERFEDLCLRLAKEEDPDCRLYGTAGQDQQGIDIIGKRKGEDKYTVYQCKRVESFGPPQIKEAVTKFLEGEFKVPAQRFVLCCTQALRETKQVKMIEAQRNLLEVDDVALEVWDAEELNVKLKSRTDLVEDFFGKAWKEAFCVGHGKPNFDQARKRLAEVYTTLDFSGVGVVQAGGPQGRVEQLRLDDAYFELRFTPEGGKEAEPILPAAILTGDRLRIVRGRGGSGKTTWLRRTFNRLLQDTGAFPFMIELRSLARDWRPTSSSLDGYLRGWLASHEVDSEILSHIWKDNSAPIPVLLVDGWDELGDLGKDIRAKLLGLVGDCPRLRVVVTSRPYGHSCPTHSDRFRLWDVAPLSPDDVKAFSTRFYAACYPGDKPSATGFDTRFQEALRRSPKAGELTEIPLLLVMMLMISRVETLPDKRHKLYERCITNLLDAIPKTQEVQGVRAHSAEWRPTDSEERLRVIARLAFDMKVGQGKGKQDSLIRTSWEQALDGLPKEWKEGEKNGFLYWLCSRAGLMVDFTDQSLQFAHLSFQEYLAAKHAKERLKPPHDLELAMERLEDTTWWETLRLWAAQVDGAAPESWDPIMDKLLESDKGLGLAGAMLADGTARRFLDQWAARFFARLRDQWTESFDYAASAFQASHDQPINTLRSAANSAAAECATGFEWLRLSGWSRQLDLTINHPVSPLLSAFAGALSTNNDASQERFSTGRILVGHSPFWPGGPVGLLNAWPSRRRLLGYRLQSWTVTTGRAVTQDVAELFWPQNLTAAEEALAHARAHDLARDCARDLSDFEAPDQPEPNWALDWGLDLATDVFLGLGRDLDLNRALDEARGWTRAWARDWAPYREPEWALDEARAWVRELSRGLAPDWTGTWARDLGLQNKYGDSVRAFGTTEIASPGRYAGRALSVHGEIPNEPRNGIARMIQLGARRRPLGAIPANTDPLWPAFARHLGRSASEEDKALLIDLAQHPEQRPTPLQWGLRYIVRGDVMQPDGAVVTLDEIADQFGLPRLAFLEEVPPPLDD